MSRCAPDRWSPRRPGFQLAFALTATAAAVTMLGLARPWDGGFGFLLGAYGASALAAAALLLGEPKKPATALRLPAAPPHGWHDETLRLPRPVLALVLIGAVALGGWLRLAGTDWDEGQHLHPDERFLTMVAEGLDWPSNLSEYFDESASPLNPRNRGHGFFVYGVAPVAAVKLVGRLSGTDGYDRIHLTGRRASGVLETLLIVMVFLLARALYRDERTALLAAVLMALAVLPIQHAHFFVTDSWATFWITAALVMLVQAQRRGRTRDYAAAGALFGLAMAGKLSVAGFVPLAVAVALWRGALGRRRGDPYAWLSSFGKLVACGLASALVFRLAAPDAFAGWIAPAGRWLNNLAEASRLASGAVDFPPGHQWTDRTPFWFPWKNMVLWGMGPLLGLAAWAGWLGAAWAWLRRGRAAHLIPVCWVLIQFAWQGGQWVKAMRYQLPIYPALVVLAAWGLVALWDATRRQRARRLAAATLIIAVAGGSLLWAVAFTRIYREPHSRVSASRWLLQNIPEGAAIANEHWDDSLPLRVDGQDPFGGRYNAVEMQWYGEDTPEKLEQALDWLDQADVIVLSSNRLSDSIARLPMRYPMTLRYYEALFSGELGFEPAAEFTSYPGLGRLSFPDQSAEEAFTVYDHPRVRIFRKTPAFDIARARALLGDVAWERIQQLTPRQATRAPNGLWLSPERRACESALPTWDELFPADGFARRHPVLVWISLLALLGIAGWPYLFAVTGWLPDRGWGLARPAGWLVVAWAAWLAVSLDFLPFDRATLLALAAAWLAGGALLAGIQARAIGRFLRRRWKPLLIGEALFWAAFAAMLLVRWLNPDLWHPQLGGEKPMDLAYLNATVRSAGFPPHNPWFAGSIINYYYFGYVPVAAAIGLTGVTPAVGYNLSIATLWAMVVAAGFSAALGVTRRAGAGIGRRAIGGALLAILLAALAGNLVQWRVLWAQWSSPGRPEAWFWDATRAISHPPTEAGPITEFPFFTYLFADLHPHALALPLALLVLGLVIELAARARRDRPATMGLGLLLALALGSLWPANAWDYPIYSALLLGGLWLRHRRRPPPERALRAALAAGLIIGLGVLAFLPFRETYGKGYTSIEWWAGSRTPPAEYLLVFGAMLLPALAAACATLWRRRPRHAWPIAAMAALAAGALAAFGLATAALVLALLAAVGLALLARPRSIGWRLGLLLVAIALALQLAVELVVLQGDIARMNTVFKFYFQSWVLLAIGVGAAVAHGPRGPRALNFAWRAMLIAVIAASLLYPLTATTARLRLRPAPTAPPTLDGEAWMANATLNHNGRLIQTKWDAEAIDWLRRTARGMPVIAEANTWPVLYGWGNRFSNHTGLPSIVGWDWHQRQQRAVLPDSGVERRIAELARIYETEDPWEARSILLRHGARYVIVGELEAACYDAAGLRKFEQAEGICWRRAYANPGVTIYELTDQPNPQPITHNP